MNDITQVLEAGGAGEKKQGPQMDTARRSRSGEDGGLGMARIASQAVIAIAITITRTTSTKGWACGDASENRPEGLNARILVREATGVVESR